MKIIVGLGNPEEKYAKTFHNMGWMAAGDLANNLGAKFKKRECEALCAETYVGGEKVIIARPLTYMNCSGRAVKQLLAKHKATPADLVVIYDDYDIPKGHVRIRPSGSAGTHNGMRSVIAEIGSSEFVRIRIGIRDPEVSVPIINYVLSNVRPEDYELFISACGRAADAALALIKGEKCENVMTKFNG
ncbi:MAG TPA: aminoacyl-tRNA hydrolase [Candidatus Coproplasma avicola]|uniref:Peptidyl-tRNA hydrolase n=1 Tax=Candidatus Coproplasma avicola TaxID=2840744 RepID=A0A9D1E5N3_9FIRM|nr:aminoacyl-tRNA hydrolase [Candidatus Coproplasma avicola]